MNQLRSIFLKEQYTEDIFCDILCVPIQGSRKHRLRCAAVRHHAGFLPGSGRTWYVTRLVLHVILLCSKSLVFSFLRRTERGIKMMYILLIAGFILLIFGADRFVDGSSEIARLLKVPSVIVGLTIVAAGTSAPEAAVSITAGIEGSSDIAMGNIVGSNIFNLLIVTGASAAVCPFISHRDILKRDIWWNLAASAALLVFAADRHISSAEGIILLSAMAVYLFVLIHGARKNSIETDVCDNNEADKVRSILKTAAGLACVVIGGRLVVNNAQLIASALGMSDTLIGLTIVAAGTSLPELVTSLTAARKGDSGIALGNAIGSNIFNILFIMGITSVISPVQAAGELVTDSIILLAAGIVFTVFIFTGKKTGRAEGIICILIYALYTVYIFMR